MTAPFAPRDPDFEARVRRSFARQAFMRTLGANLTRVEPGDIAVAFPVTGALAQQHGYVHAGAVSAAADTACGYAALTLAEPDREVLTVEFKVNLVAPAEGDRIVCAARVLRPGRTLTVCAAEVHAERAGGSSPTLIAVMQATVIAVGP